MNSYITALQQANELEAQAQLLRMNAQSYKREKASKDKTMKSWIGYRFESSSMLTDEFACFARQYKRTLVKIMTGYEMINWSRGHFEVSTFLKNIRTGKIVYISISDVRFFSDEWYNNILIRTVTSEHDYTGGSNNYATLETLRYEAEKLTA